MTKPKSDAHRPAWRLSLVLILAVLLAAAAAYGWRLTRQAPMGNGQAVSASAGYAAHVSGRVVLADALRGQVEPGDTVFIFARLLDGPRAPVAVLQRSASELPLDFRLDESTATNPALRLSASTLLVVGARISRPGQATPQPLDWQGRAEPVPVGTRGVQIEIDQKLR